MSTFVELLCHHDLRIPFLSISDAPAHAHRGVHLGLPPREEIAFFERLIRHLLLPYRYNTVFLEFAGGMEFDRHPEIHEAWREANRRAAAGEIPPVPHGSMVAGGDVLTKQEVRGIVEVIKRYGIEVIPEVQTLAHVEYLNLSHPEFAEIPADPDAPDEIGSTIMSDHTVSLR